MKPVRPEELSALLDGELAPERAREVEQQIATDPALRSEFEALSGADAQWRSAAATAAFAPAVELPKDESRLGWVAAAVALIGGLVFLRAAPKLVDSLAFGFGLHALCLTVLLVVLVQLTRTGRHGPLTLT